MGHSAKFRKELEFCKAHQNTEKSRTKKMSARSIVRFVNSTSMGPLKRLVGSVDCEGQGTKHELEGLDPVVLCDTASISGAGKHPFGLHPHYGLIAVTAVVEGCFSDG